MPAKYPFYKNCKHCNKKIKINKGQYNKVYCDKCVNTVKSLRSIKRCRALRLVKKYDRDKPFYKEDGVDLARKAANLKELQPKKIKCLKCDELFLSPNKSTIRICDTCKGHSTVSVISGQNYMYL